MADVRTKLSGNSKNMTLNLDKHFWKMKKIFLTKNRGELLFNVTVANRYVLLFSFFFDHISTDQE